MGQSGFNERRTCENLASAAGTLEYRHQLCEACIGCNCVGLTCVLGRSHCESNRPASNESFLGSQDLL